MVNIYILANLLLQDQLRTIRFYCVIMFLLKIYFIQIFIGYYNNLSNIIDGIFAV